MKQKTHMNRYVSGTMRPLTRMMEQGPLYRTYFFKWRFIGVEVLFASIGVLCLLAGLYWSFKTPDVSAVNAPHFETEHANKTKERIASGNKGNRLVAHIPRQASRRKLNIAHSDFIDDQEIILTRTYRLIKTDLSQKISRDIQELPNFEPTEIMRKGPIIAPIASSNKTESSLTKTAYKLYDLPIEGLTKGEDEASADILQSITQAALSHGHGRTPDDNSYARFDEEVLASIENTVVTDVDVNLTPINIVSLAQTQTNPLAGTTRLSEITFTLEDNGKIYPTLKKLGIETSDEIIPVLDQALPLISLQAGWRLRVGFVEEPITGNRLAYALALYKGEERLAAIRIKNDRTYEVVDNHDGVFAESKATLDEPTPSKPITLYESLFATTSKQRLPKALFEQLVAIFIYDVDFKKKISTNDQLEIIYTEPGTKDDPDNFIPQIIYAALRHQNIQHSYYLFQDTQSDTEGYFDENGQSAQKFLMKKPMEAGIFRSGFGLRRHPILKKLRMHNGIDWSARTGTPIFAAGNGVVTYIGWKGGYGRHLRIQHANGYQTTYSHMSRIADNITKGTRVSLGQTIAYVGSTGLSTGPHLHYEVLINGKFVNPAKLMVPRGETLSGARLNRFQLFLDELRKGMNPPS